MSLSSGSVTESTPRFPWDSEASLPTGANRSASGVRVAPADAGTADVRCLAVRGGRFEVGPRARLTSGRRPEGRSQPRAVTARGFRGAALHTAELVVESVRRIMRSGSDPKPDNYYQNAREEVLPFIPGDATRALEVGCGEGHFGARLKARGVREVWGIELAEDAARRASDRLERVLVGDIGRLIQALPAGYFDVVVFNDVLEHLVDPYDVLARIPICLNQKGVVVSSIPNIRFLPTFYELLAHKEWEYEESGILDRTHLRFFTVTSIPRMYERLGYEVLRHEGINPIEHLPRRYRLANTLLRGRLSDMRFTQFATVARPIRHMAGDA